MSYLINYIQLKRMKADIRGILILIEQSWLSFAEKEGMGSVFEIFN